MVSVNGYGEDREWLFKNVAPGILPSDEGACVEIRFVLFYTHLCAKTVSYSVGDRPTLTKFHTRVRIPHPCCSPFIIVVDSCSCCIACSCDEYWRRYISRISWSFLEGHSQHPKLYCPRLKKSSDSFSVINTAFSIHVQNWPSAKLPPARPGRRWTSRDDISAYSIRQVFFLVCCRACLGDSVMTHGRYVLPAMRTRVHEVCAVPAQHFVPAWPQRDAPARVIGDRRSGGVRAKPEPGSHLHHDPDRTTPLAAPSHEGPDGCEPQVLGEARARCHPFRRQAAALLR